MKLLIHSRTSTVPTLKFPEWIGNFISYFIWYNGCNYLTMLRFKLIHVSKMGLGWQFQYRIRHLIRTPRNRETGSLNHRTALKFDERLCRDASKMSTQWGSYQYKNCGFGSLCNLIIRRIYQRILRRDTGTKDTSHTNMVTLMMFASWILLSIHLVASVGP